MPVAQDSRDHRSQCSFYFLYIVRVSCLSPNRSWDGHSLPLSSFLAEGSRLYKEVRKGAVRESPILSLRASRVVWDFSGLHGSQVSSWLVPFSSLLTVLPFLMFVSPLLSYRLLVSWSFFVLKTNLSSTVVQRLGNVSFWFIVFVENYTLKTRFESSALL